MKQKVKFTILFLLMCYQLQAQVGRGKIATAEIYFDTDPGIGLATSISLDINLEMAIRTAITTQSPLLGAGLHSINVRLKDSLNHWGPTFSTTIVVENGITSRNISASIARVYWDNNLSSAQLMTVFNGNPSDVINSFIENGNLPSFGAIGLHKLNVQVYGANNAFSPVFSTVVNFESVLTTPRIIAADLMRLYWDTNISAAEGLIILNGNSSTAINTFINSSTSGSALTSGIHRINVQMADLTSSLNYGPVFTNTILVEEQLTNSASQKVIEARVWVDNDTPPAIGNMIAFDGNFNDALETAYQGLSPLAIGMHSIHVQLRDSANGWGPQFKTSLSVENPISYRNIHVSKMQMYWDNNQADSTVLLVFNNNYTEAIESALSSQVTTPTTIGLHTLNVRVQDIADNWSQTFKTIVKIDAPITKRTIHVTEGEVSIDANPPSIILGMNGNFNEALENVSASLLSSGLSAGLHTIRVRIKGTDNNWGNYFTRSMLVSPCYSTPMPVVTSSGPLSFCFGSSVTLTANAGYTSYTWLRGNTIVGNTASLQVTTEGNYSVVVTDSTNCPNTSIPITVNVFTPTVTISSGTTLCQGSIDSLIATSGFASYQWSAGSTINKQFINTSGTYTVTITDSHGCTDSESTTINQLNSPSPPVITVSGPLSFCPGSSVTLQSNYVSNIYWSNGLTSSSFTTDTSGVYTVIVTGNNGCTSSATATTTRFAAAQAIIGYVGPLEYCINQPTVLSANISSQYYWSNGGTASSIAPLISGSYFVQIVDSNGCSTQSNLITVIVRPLPTVPIVTASGPLSFCNGNSVTLTSTQGLQHLWNSGATLATLVVTQSATLVDTVINQYGCKSWSDTIVVDVHPTASITSNGPTTVCYGDSVTLTAHPSNGVRYLWSNGSSAQQIILHSSALANVIVTETLTGCSDTASTNVVVNPLPTGTITAAGPTLVCTGNSLMINAIGSAHTKFKWYLNGDPLTYSIWSLNCNCYQTYNVYGYSYSATTSGIYSALVIDTITGCTQFTNSISFSVQVPMTPLISANGGTTLCIGANTQLSCSTAQSYLWSNGSTTSTTIANTQGYYVVTTTDNLGCTATSIPTYVSFYPVASIVSSGPTSFCQGEHVNLTATPIGTYLWSDYSTNGSINNINTAGTYSVTVTDVNGCSSISDPVTISVNPLPTGTLVASGSTTICSGNNVILYTSATPNSISRWYFNGAPILVNYNNIHYTGYNYSATIAGNYTAEIIDTITGCRSFTNGIQVTVLSLPNVQISQLTQVQCYGGNGASLIAAGSGTVGPYTYQWNNGTTVNSIVGISAGNYIVEVIDINGCTDKDTFNVTQPSPLNATAHATANTGGYHISCPGVNDGTAYVTAGGTPPYSYLWSTGDTTLSVHQLSAGIFTVIITDANNCTGTSSVTLLSPPQVNLTLSPSIYIGGNNTTCSGDSSGSITGTRTGGVGPSHFSWSTGDTTTVLSHLHAGNYSVIVSDYVGCTATGSITLTAPAPLQATLTATNNNGYNLTCSNSHDGTISVSTVGGVLGYKYWWVDNTTTKDRTGLTQGDYQLIVTDTNGCVDTNTIKLTAPDSIASITTGSMLDCFGMGNGTGSVIANGGIGPYSYLWSNGSSAVLATGLSAGIHQITVTDSRGCTLVTPVEVKQPQELIGYAFGTYIDCGSQIGLLSITAAGGNSPYNFVWSNGSTAAFQINQPAGNYSVTVTDLKGCIDTTYAIILNPPDLQVSVSNSTVQCENSVSGTLAASVTGGVAPFMYLWNNGATTPLLSNIGIGNYTVVVTDANGCTTHANPTITALTVIHNQFTQNSTCINGQGSISVTATGGTIPYSYSWNTGSVTPLITGVTTGPYAITTTDANGCIGRDSMFYYGIEVSALGDTLFCHGDSVQLTVSSGTNYLWNTGDTVQTIYVNSSGNYHALVNGCPSTNSISTLSTYCYQQVNLKVFIQGFYDPSTDSMVAVLDPINQPFVCDSVTLQLMDANGYHLASTSSGTIDRGGHGEFNFTGLMPGHRYYIAIRHRNSIETWSKNSFLFLSPITIFDFSTP